MVLPFGEIKWIKSVQTYYRGDFQEKNKQNIGESLPSGSVVKN